MMKKDMLLGLCILTILLSSIASASDIFVFSDTDVDPSTITSIEVIDKNSYHHNDYIQSDNF
ncbi:hypothetical protein ACFL0V_05650, partial [Nanoarchaeota archaeon]